MEEPVNKTGAPTSETNDNNIAQNNDTLLGDHLASSSSHVMLARCGLILLYNAVITSMSQIICLTNKTNSSCSANKATSHLFCIQTKYKSFVEVGNCVTSYI